MSSVRVRPGLLSFQPVLETFDDNAVEGLTTSLVRDLFQDPVVERQRDVDGHRGHEHRPELGHERDGIAVMGRLKGMLIDVWIRLPRRDLEPQNPSSTVTHARQLKLLSQEGGAWGW